jgi:hypothetical protein
VTAAPDADRTLVPRLQAEIAQLRRDVEVAEGVASHFATEVNDLAGADNELANLHRKIRAIHQEFEGRCSHCVEWCDCLDRDPDARVADCAHGNVDWPCPTIQALT